MGVPPNLWPFALFASVCSPLHSFGFVWEVWKFLKTSLTIITQPPPFLDKLYPGIYISRTLTYNKGKISMESSNAAGKPVRNIRKDTATWRLFEHFFLMQEASAYPLRIPCETWGQALNLSVGLNRCHVQHQRETGMPDEAMLYSAKPARNQEDTEFWVEVSTNYRRQGIASPSKLARQAGGNWIEKLLVKAEEVAPSAPTPEGTQPVPDKMESLLDNFMKGENDAPTI